MDEVDRNMTIKIYFKLRSYVLRREQQLAQNCCFGYTNRCGDNYVPYTVKNKRTEGIIY